jgi:phage repressor protein C with HTH and peptisase S24 domain
MSETNNASFKDNITKRTIDRIVKRYPFVNPLWLMHGTGQMIDTPPKSVCTKFSYAPLVSQRAAAGYLSGFADEEYIGSLEKVPYVEDEETKGNVIAVEVSGDSMDDGTAECYRDGDIVLAKEVRLDSISIRRHDFVIVHKTGILIKRISEIGSQTITIHSLNRDYGDVEISQGDILKIFIVTTRISKQRR